MLKKGGMTYQYPRRMGDCMDFRCAFCGSRQLCMYCC